MVATKGPRPEEGLCPQGGAIQLRHDQASRLCGPRNSLSHSRERLMSDNKILKGAKEALAFARGTKIGNPDCSICGGSGYVVEHVETTAWREAVKYDHYKPCSCTQRGG